LNELSTIQEKSQRQTIMAKSKDDSIASLTTGFNECTSTSWILGARSSNLSYVK